MVLILSSQQLANISAHAERVYPEECCGLMVGTITAQAQAAQTQTVQTQTAQAQTAQAQTVQKHLSKVVPLDNDWTPEALPADIAESVTAEASQSKQRRYWIKPEDMLRAQKSARDQGLVIVGIYHSHPDHVAEPSECDRTLAWHTYAYTIVSVCEGKAVDVQNWALDSEHQFQPEAIRVSPSSARDRMPVSA